MRTAGIDLRACLNVVAMNTDCCTESTRGAGLYHTLLCLKIIIWPHFRYESSIVVVAATSRYRISL